MSLLKRIEKTLDERLRGIFGGSSDEPASSEAIELYRAALDQVAARASVGKRGSRVFPFDRIRLELEAAGPERRALLEALFSPEQMLADVRSSLVETGVEAPDELAVTVEYPENPVVEMRVICEKAPEPQAPPPAPETPLVPMRLITVTGASSQPDFLADRPHINLGRVHEVLDAMGRTVRRNDLTFAEGADDITATVSRAHAHLQFDGASGDWRIYDDGSSVGTVIFRDGKRIDVPPHAARGVRLLPGDEIYLGQARLRCECA